MPSKPIIYKYPLDLTGNNPNNLIVGEPHTLTGGQNRALVPNYGAFFSDSLVVRDSNSGVTLTPRTQFKAVQLYTEATHASGLEVMSVIVITDPSVSSQVEIDYQVVGGDFSYSVPALRDMIENLELDNRPVAWGDLIGTPNFFPPAPHLHDAGDVYGFEYLVEAVEAVRQAVLVGHEGVVEELRSMIGVVDSKTRPVASLEQVLSSVDEELIVKPSDLKIAFDTWADTYLQDQEALSNLNVHLGTSNAHEVSSSSIGLGGLTDIGLMSLDSVYYEALDVVDGNESTLVEIIDLHLRNKRDTESYNSHSVELNPHEEDADVLGLEGLVGSELGEGSDIYVETEENLDSLNG